MPAENDDVVLVTYLREAGNWEILQLLRGPSTSVLTRLRTPLFNFSKNFLKCELSPEIVYD